MSVIQPAEKAPQIAMISMSSRAGTALQLRISRQINTTMIKSENGLKNSHSMLAGIMYRGG